MCLQHLASRCTCNLDKAAGLCPGGESSAGAIVMGTAPARHGHGSPTNKLEQHCPIQDSLLIHVCYIRHRQMNTELGKLFLWTSLHQWKAQGFLVLYSFHAKRRTESSGCSMMRFGLTENNVLSWLNSKHKFWLCKEINNLSYIQ